MIRLLVVSCVCIGVLISSNGHAVDLFVPKTYGLNWLVDAEKGCSARSVAIYVKATALNVGATNTVTYSTTQDLGPRAKSGWALSNITVTNCHHFVVSATCSFRKEVWQGNTMHYETDTATKSVEITPCQGGNVNVQDSYQTFLLSFWNPNK